MDLLILASKRTREDKTSDGITIPICAVRIELPKEKRRNHEKVWADSTALSFVL